MYSERSVSPVHAMHLGGKLDGAGPDERGKNRTYTSLGWRLVHDPSL